MARDEDRLVLDQLALRRQAAEKRKAEFLEALPEGYPTPRADQEWQAYRGLLRHWTRRQIQRFVKAYLASKMMFPGTLDTPGYPTLSEFQRDVGLLAEGEYVRTLPRPEMLALLSGEDAVRGAKTLSSAAEGGRARRGMRDERDRKMAEEFLRRFRTSRKSSTTLKAEIGGAEGLKRSASVAAINRGLHLLSS